VNADQFRPRRFAARRRNWGALCLRVSVVSYVDVRGVHLDDLVRW